MKLRNYVLLACMAATNLANAQTPTTNQTGEGGLYVRAGVGYAFTHAGQTSILNGLPLKGTISTSKSSGSRSVKKGSLGTGFGVCLAGGYMISRHVGLELAIDATIGPKKYKFTETDVNTSYTQVFNYTVNAKHPIYIIPGILLTTGGDELNLYTRLGLALPVSEKVTIKSDGQYTYNGTTDVSHYEYELTNRFSLGITGAVGVSYPVSDMITLG